MPDYGQRATDAEFRRLRARINDVYKQAYKEIEQKGREFAQGHARREAQLRQMVADGKMTQADFDAWMRGQVFQGKQWEAKKQQMADTLYHADQVAQQMVNDSRFNVFAANANYMGYSLEHDAGIKTNFGLYDADSVRRLVKKEPDLLPPKKYVGKDKSYQWYNRQVQTAITQGIIQGESLDKIAHRIGKQTGETSMTAMLRNARTMQTGAQNAGRIEGLHQAQELGIKVKKQWMATLDHHTRDAHADLDGQVADVDEPFDSELGPIMYPGDPDADPANVWNCFIGQTKVASDSEIVRSYKHDYSGELFVIKTARGVEFTCTPNHPILTPRGWIGANRLHEGDNILVAGIGDLDVLGIDPDVNHVFSRFDTLHELFKETFCKRATGLSVDFHGDRATANVEVVSKERFLMDNGNASSGEMGDKLQLKHSAALVLTKRHFVPGLRRVHITALRLMRRTGKPLSLFGRGLSHAIKHGFRTVPRGDTAILEPKRDGMSGDVQFLGQSLDGFPGQILVDDIVNINITTVSHIPVFNLQTRNGYYFVNDIIAQNREKCNGYFAIAHNCRCTLVYVYPEYPNSMERRDNETGENVGDMTYREWEAMKRGDSEAPEPEKAPPQFEIRHADFTPAASVKEAEEYASQFMGYNGKVSYRGLSVDAANACNQILADMRANIPGFKLSGIEPMNMRSSMWKGKTAEAAYRWGGDGKLYINPTYYKNAKVYGEHVAEIDRLTQTVLLSGQELIDSGRVSGTRADYISALLETKRQAVSQSHDFMQGTFVHEMGHALDDKYVRRELRELYPGIDGVRDFLSQSRTTYGSHISGYAIADGNEYIAESFTAWWYGERDKVDPVLSGVFEKVMTQ